MCGKGFAALPSRPDDNLGRGEESSEQRGAHRHGLGENVLVIGVRAITDGTEAIKSRNTKSCCEVAVGTATSRGFSQRETELLGEGNGTPKENSALLAFQRRAIEAAMDFEPGAAMDRFQFMQALFEGAHVGCMPSAKIKLGFGQFRDNVDARAAFDNVCIDGDAAPEVVPLLDTGDLRGEFVNSVDALFRGKPSVRRATVNNDLGLADALAGSFDETTRSKGRFENKDGVTAAGFRFDQNAGGFAADFLVGSPEEDEALGNLGLSFLQDFESKKRLDDSGLHVESAGAISFVAHEAVRHFGDSASRIDGIVMAEDEELRSGRRNRGGPNDAKMIATMLLAEHLNKRAPQQPLVGEEAAAAVSTFFIQTGRLKRSELLEDFQHVRQPAAEQAQKSSRN